MAKDKGAQLIPSFLPRKGERALIVGQTGSGKTAFATFVLKRLEQSPIVIYDTKNESKFHALQPSTVVNSFDAVIDAYESGEWDYIIFRPPLLSLTNKAAMDDYLLRHHLELPDVPAYIDEAYSFTKNTWHGPGITGLLTRGRSKGQTTIISSQLPKFISPFCVTEAQKLYTFFLGDMRDKKRLGDVIPNFEKLASPPEHGFHFFHVGSREEPVLFDPIPLDDKVKTGYTDTIDLGDVATRLHKHIWL